MPDQEQRELTAQINRLLANQAYAGHPLRQALADLYSLFQGHLRSVERVVRISDHYQDVARETKHELTMRYGRQLKKLEKIARISDGYQSMMRDSHVVLKEEATRDSLTGLGNRRLLMDRLKLETVRAARRNHALTVAFADIDHFKMVNDTYGHANGDQVLIEVARVLEFGVREYDLCGRWGGEEFLIILPGIGIAEALPTVERLRVAVGKIDMRLNDRPLALSISFGVAEHRLSDDITETINRADAALYAAKRGGRNRCEIAAMSL